MKSSILKVPISILVGAGFSFLGALTRSNVGSEIWDSSLFYLIFLIAFGLGYFNAVDGWRSFKVATGITIGLVIGWAVQLAIAVHQGYRPTLAPLALIEFAIDFLVLWFFTWLGSTLRHFNKQAT